MPGGFVPRAFNGIHKQAQLVHVNPNGLRQKCESLTFHNASAEDTFLAADVKEIKPGGQVAK